MILMLLTASLRRPRDAVVIEVCGMNCLDSAPEREGGVVVPPVGDVQTAYEGHHPLPAALVL